MMVVLPWYERDRHGVWTGREWATETQARTEVAPGCTVHVELSAVVQPATFGEDYWEVVQRTWLRSVLTNALIVMLQPCGEPPGRYLKPVPLEA